MKLYTEEQVRNAMRADFILDEEIDNLINKLTPIELPSNSLCINCDESESTHNICMNCIIKIGKENIQLPTDEEIDKQAEYEDNYSKKCAFTRGAKWMGRKTFGGNK
jgi:hypothetical protein